MVVFIEFVIIFNMSSENLRAQNALLRQYVVGLENENQSRNREAGIMQQQIDSLNQQIKDQQFQRTSNMLQLTKLKQQVYRLQTQNEQMILERPFKQLKIQYDKKQQQLFNLEIEIIKIKEENKELKRQIQDYETTSANSSDHRVSLQHNRIKYQLEKCTQEKTQLLEKNKELVLEKEAMDKIIKNYKSPNRADDRYTFGTQFIKKVQKGQDTFNNVQLFQTSIQNNINHNHLLQKIKQLENQLQKTKITLKSLRQENLTARDAENQRQDMKNKIQQLQKQNNEQRLQINRKISIIYEIEKAITQKDQQIHDITNRYQQIIQAKNSELFNRNQVYNQRIQMLSAQLQKTQQKLSENDNNELEIENKLLINELEKKQTIIQFLKQQNHNFLQSGTSQIKPNIRQNKITPPKKLQIQTQQNNDIKYNSPESKRKKTPVNQQELRKTQSQSQQIKSILVARKSDYQKKNSNHVRIHTPTTNNYSETIETQHPKDERKPNSITIDDNFIQFSNYPSPNNGNLRPYLVLEKEMRSPKKSISRVIIKPVSQIKPYGREQSTNVHSRINTNMSNANAPFSIVNKMYQEVDSPSYTNQGKWQEVQKKINLLRKENKDLKKNLFN